MNVIDRKSFLKIGVFATASAAFGLEGVVGKVSDKLTKNPVENAVLKLYKYPEGDFIEQLSTDSNGYFNPTQTEVKYDLWNKIKKLYDGILEDNEKNMGKIAKRAESGIIKADILHPDYQNAIRYFDLLGNNFDTTITPKNFDINAFDTWTRASGKGLKKWLNQPAWKINVAGAERTYIDLVKEIISNDIADAMNWNNPLIREVETANNIEQEGEYLVYWRSGTGDYSNNHNETLRGNEIISASAWFYEPNRLRRVFLKTLTQGLGLVRNPSGNEFYTPEGYYTQQGKDMLTILCSMNAGNISPDTDAVPV